MAEISREEFKRAYRKEKDLRVAKRMAAVNMAHYNRESAQHVADSLIVSELGSDVGTAV